MRTNHQLARMKSHTLGYVPVYGNAGKRMDGGIFNSISTFGGVPKAVKARRAGNRQSTALIAQGDSLSDNFLVPSMTTVPGDTSSTSQQTRAYAQAITADLMDADSLESDSSLVGQSLLTYDQWDAGNPAPRSGAEKAGRETAYAAYANAWRSANPAMASTASGLGSIAYFGSDPKFLRKEGGTMNSITTFGNVPDEGESGLSAHAGYVAGGAATSLALLGLGLFVLKWKRLI